MKVELRKIDRSNFQECVSLEVAPEQRQYIATNADSLKEAEENSYVAAISLYHTFGFRKTGQMNEDEMVYELTLHK